MAEYVLREDEDQTTVAQELLANADHPDHVQWRPRSGVPHGGVYEIDDGLAERMIAHRRSVAEAESTRIADALAAAEERDSADGVAEGLVTPAEAGFAASTGTDPGASPAAPVEGEDQDEFLADARTLSDEAWVEKYGDEPRPAMGELEHEDDPADETPADEPAKPNRKASRRKATTPAVDEPALTNTEGK